MAKIETQAKNEVFIEGILLESKIKTDVSKEDNKPFIRGEISIQVDQVIGGQTICSTIPIRMFAMQYTKKGKKNPAYESIEKLRDTFTSAAAAGGLDGADGIRITTGTLNENIFIPRGSEKEVSFTEIQSNFFTKVSRQSLTPMTKFSVNVAVQQIKEDIDRNGDPTGALILKGGVVQYGSKLDIIEFKIHNEAAKDFIQRTYKGGDCVNIQGYLNFSAKTEYVEEEAGFGEAIKVPKTTTVRELVITTGSIEPFNEERAYAREDLNKILGDRMARIIALKEDSKKAPAAAPAAGGFGNGF